jgi:RNA polymerase sigma factor (sigma-70 family)
VGGGEQGLRVTGNDCQERDVRIVRKASYEIYSRFFGLLRCHGHTSEDVIQQAWVEFLKLKKEWPTNPGKYLKRRMVDWMRVKTGYSRASKTGVKIFAIDTLHTEAWHLYGRDYERLEPKEPSIDYERRDILQKLNAHMRTDREKNMLNCYLSGEPLSSVGERHGVSEKRVSQIFRRAIKGLQSSVVNILLMISAFVFLLPFGAFAQDSQIMIAVVPGVETDITGCSALRWTMPEYEDAESLAGFNVHISKDGSVLPHVVVNDPAQRSIECAELPIGANGSYSIQMSAFDEFDQSSPLSSPPILVRVIPPPPAAPSICLDITVDGHPRSLCLSLDGV